MTVEDLALAAADMWNAIARAQERVSSDLVVHQGMHPLEAAMAVYVVAQAMVAKFGAILEPEINEEARQGVALLVKTMVKEASVGVHAIDRNEAQA